MKTKPKRKSVSKKAAKEPELIDKPEKKPVKKQTVKSKKRGGKLRRLKLSKRVKLILLGVLLSILVPVGVVAAVVLKDLPSPKTLESDAFPVSTQIMDRNGILLYEVYADTRRTPIALNELPDYVYQATIAIEDQSFYKHFGFSVQGIARAVRNTVFKNKLQGGSTITQQLVKTALLSPERTIKRKIREAVLTVGTEIIYTKEQILEMYLNHIPYGGTAYGIEAAAQKFFNKPAKELNLSEATLLAGLPQAPSRYSPFTNPEAARNRQKEVLRRMMEDGHISQEEVDKAVEEELTFAAPSTDIKAPHFVFYVIDILEKKYGLQTVERGGLKVVTSLDLELHEYAQASVSAEVESLERARVSNGAALITKPNTGEVLAMVGSKNYFETENDGQVNLTTSLRQPGSSIKPINYVTALQLKKLHPASVLIDVRTCFPTGGPAYCPKNYDYGFHGLVQFRQALANSYNIPAVKVLAINSVESMIATASAMGIDTFTQNDRYGLALTLGGGEVLMTDMAEAFGTLANQGVRVDLKPILSVTDYKGEVLEEYKPEENIERLKYFFDEEEEESNLLGVEKEGMVRVLNREPAYQISHILADNNARAAAFGFSSQLRIRGKQKDKFVSVKTGTTNDLRDNWTVGYTQEYLVVSWVGNNDNSSMNQRVVSGLTGAAPIWNRLMTYLLRDSEDTEPPRPKGLRQIAICIATGNPKYIEGECEARGEWFWEEFLPKEVTERKQIWVFADTGEAAFFNQRLDGDPSNTDNLLLVERLVISDPFTKDYCLDCLPPEPEPETEPEIPDPTPVPEPEKPKPTAPPPSPTPSPSPTPKQQPGPPIPTI